MKTNRTKLFGAVLTGLMLLNASLPVMAADITVDGTGAGYDAYKLMSLTTSLKGDCGHDDGGHGDDCWNYSYTVNGEYRDAMKAGLTGADVNADADGDGAVTDAELIEAVSGLDATTVRTFADGVFAAIGAKTADFTATDKTFSDVDQGYYLITESSLAGDPDARSLVMLDTAGQENITVKSKEGVPTLTKQINDAGDLVDAVDVNAGDTVNFVLTGTMPDNIDNYDTFKYAFHDNISDGLVINTGSVKVTIDGADVTSAFSTADVDGCSLDVSCVDIKNAGVDVTKDSQVVLTYSATLTGAFTTASTGNPNEAALEFSNDPYNTDSTSETVKDKVNVFTYEVTVNKVDKDGEELEGAMFKLVCNGREFEPAEELGTTTFTFKGLDAGEYTLVETTVPDGYNKADDVVFEIVADYDKNSENPQLTGLKVMQDGEEVSAGEDALFSVVVADGTIATAVINSTGIRMPGTGGAGTYAIYAGGAALLMAGGIAIVATRRKKDNTAE